MTISYRDRIGVSVGAAFGVLVVALPSMIWWIDAAIVHALVIAVTGSAFIIAGVQFRSFANNLEDLRVENEHDPDQPTCPPGCVFNRANRRKCCPCPKRQ